MSEIIHQLQEEHVNMGLILDLLAAEVDCFRDGQVMDTHLVQEILDYCLDYPNACHHPKEDAIYAVMIGRNPDLSGGIADLAAAHDNLSGQTRHVHLTMERIMRDETMARDKVLGVFDRFLHSYRLHIHLEEESFFPEALRLLDARDWQVVADNLPIQVNPLKAAADDRRYATLRAGILRLDPMVAIA